jgi:hypothetical protein
VINIYSTDNSEEVDLSADASKPSKPIQVLTLSLPQGSYLVLAQVALWNGGIIPEIAQCNLGPAIAGATIDGLSMATIPLQTTASGGTQTLQCSINGASKVVAGGARMTAVQGLNIVNQ